MAAVFAGTLFVYLIATAIPASAATTCASATNFAANDEMSLAVGTDDKVIVAPLAGVWNISINSGAFAVCAATATVANVKWINVTGSDAGAETVTFYNPAVAFSAINTTVNLGNGSDTVVFDYAAIGGPPALADTGVGANLGFGNASDGSVNGGSPVAGIADFRVTGAENMIVNGSDSLVSGDTLSLSDILQTGVSAAGPIAGTADDTLPTVTPVSIGVTYNAGSGNDTLVSGDGADNFQGGPGADTVSYAGASAGVTADLTASTGTGQGNDTLADVQNVIGSPFADTITGNILDNVLNGGGGADTIDGGAGNDTLTGDAGDDTLMGGTGDDNVSGGGGDDTVVEDAAANGMDVLSGGVGGEVVGDTLDYSARTTDIVVNAGAGAVSGASGEKDTVAADFENYLTGSGNDTLTGWGGDEFFDPGSGTNTVDGDGGPGDYLDLSSQTGPSTIDLSGNAGTATAGTTVDTFLNIEGIVGTSANDTLNWDGTGTLLDFVGLDGIDTVDASAASVNVTIDLSAFSGNPPLGDVENAIGGSGNDTLIGNGRDNVLTGNAGDDVIAGNAGNDTIRGGDGSDSMNGGTGADALVFDRAGHGVNVDNQLGFATGQGSDTISFFEIVKGTNSKDTIIGGQTAFDGNNRYFGFGGDDLLIGTNSTDVIRAGGGDDIVHGGGGDDILSGASGSDKLYGSTGDDILFGGKGLDWGWGGAGNDSCHSIKFQNSC